MSDRGWLSIACAMLIGVLGAGWVQEVRLQERRYIAVVERCEARIGAIGQELVIAHEALRLATDPLTRAVAGAQAVRNVLERLKKSAADKPASIDKSDEKKEREK